ncbi:hypothetical protein Tco_0103357 [Tanacetum coccineum]
MADVNAPVEQAPTLAPPTRTDEQILPRIRWRLPPLRQYQLSQFWDTICYDRTDGGYKCQLDEQWFNLTKDTLGDALQITPVNNNKAFSSPPTQDTLINFVNSLGYPKKVKHLSNVVTNDMFQPWRALTTIINLCLTGKTSGFERPRAPVLQILWGVINQAHIDYAERMWEEFTQSIHTFTEDKKNLAQHTLGKKKATLIVIPSVSAKGTKREVLWMPIQRIIIDNIRGVDLLQCLSEETKRTKAGKVAKKQTLKRSQQLVDEVVDEDEEVPLVVKSGAPDEGQAGPNPGIQDEGQDGPNPGNDIVSQTLSTLGENLKLTVDDLVIPEEPTSSTGTLSSLQHLAKDFSFDDQLFNDKPSEANNEKTTVDTEAESMVSITIHQDTSVIPPFDSRKKLKQYIADLVVREPSLGGKIRQNGVQMTGASGASGSSQSPPPPPPPSNTQGGQSTSTAAPSSSKTAASAEYTAWTMTDTTIKPSISPIPEELHMGDDSTADEQAYSSSGEDVGRDHIPTVNLRQSWWKPITEDRPATPEPAWSIPSSALTVPTNNWASALKSTYTPPPENSLLAQIGDMTTFMDWYCKKQGISELTQQDLEGPAYEIVKVFHPDVVNLQFQMEECHKLLTDQVDDAS